MSEGDEPAIGIEVHIEGPGGVRVEGPALDLHSTGDGQCRIDTADRIARDDHGLTAEQRIRRAEGGDVDREHTQIVRTTGEVHGDRVAVSAAVPGHRGLEIGAGAIGHALRAIGAVDEHMHGD